MSSANVSNSNHDPGTSSVVTDPDPSMVSSDPAVVTDPDPSMVSSDPAVVTDPDPSIVSPASDPSTVLRIRRKEQRKHTLDDDLLGGTSDSSEDEHEYDVSSRFAVKRRKEEKELVKAVCTVSSDPSIVSSDPAAITDPDPSIVSPASDPNPTNSKEGTAKKTTLDDDLSKFYKPSSDKRRKTPVVKY